MLPSDLLASNHSAILQSYLSCINEHITSDFAKKNIVAPLMLIACFLFTVSLSFVRHNLY